MSNTQQLAQHACPRCGAPIQPARQVCAVCHLPLDPASIQAFYKWQTVQGASSGSGQPTQQLGSTSAPPEISFYDTGSVSVTNTRAIVFGKTYALANITSVRKVTYPPSPTWPLIIGGVGLVMALLSLPGLTKVSGTAIGFFILGVILMVLALWLLRQLKPTFGVVLGSASAEHSIVNNPNEEEIDSLMSALNQAIIHRG